MILYILGSKIFSAIFSQYFGPIVSSAIFLPGPNPPGGGGGGGNTVGTNRRNVFGCISNEE